MKKEWRVLLPGDTDPHRNMALEESLLLSVEDSSSPNTLRFWKNERSVFLGFSEKPEEELDLESCFKYHVSVVKRFTGGGTVYHDLGNLNWTIVYQKNSHIMKNIKGFTDIFMKLSYPLIASLQDLDVDAKFKPPTGIYLFDKKISGMAMRIKRNSILCHGTLLIDADLNILHSILRNLKEPVTNINDYTSTKISQSDIIQKMIENVQKIFRIQCKYGDLNRTEKKNIE